MSMLCFSIGSQQLQSSRLFLSFLINFSPPHNSNFCNCQNQNSTFTSPSINPKYKHEILTHRSCRPCHFGRSYQQAFPYGEFPCIPVLSTIVVLCRRLSMSSFSLLKYSNTYIRLTLSFLSSFVLFSNSFIITIQDFCHRRKLRRRRWIRSYLNMERQFKCW